VYFVIYIEFSLFFVYQQQSSDWLWRPAASNDLYCVGWGVKGLNCTQSNPIVSYLYTLNNEICRPAHMTIQTNPIFCYQIP